MAKPIFPFFWHLKTKNVYVREFLAEFLGTFVLILIGDAAFAFDILAHKGIKDVFAIVFCWGVAVMLGISVAGGVSGGHLNPALTLGLACVKKMPWKKVPIYMSAQYLGGFLASVILYITYYDGLNNFDGGHRILLGQNGTALIWATYPREGVRIGFTFFNEVVSTGLLTLTAVAIIDKKNMKFSPDGEVLFLGFMIATLAMCFGYNNMAPLNPARDLPPRLFTAIAGWGLETFTYRHYWWVGIIGPHVGGVVGVFLYYVFVELHLPDEEPEEENELKTRKEKPEYLYQEEQPQPFLTNSQIPVNSSDL